MLHSHKTEEIKHNAWMVFSASQWIKVNLTQHSSVSCVYLLPFESGKQLNSLVCLYCRVYTEPNTSHRWRWEEEAWGRSVQQHRTVPRTRHTTACLSAMFVVIIVVVIIVIIIIINRNLNVVDIYLRLWKTVSIPFRLWLMGHFCPNPVKLLRLLQSTLNQFETYT
jgi:uncharacterized integral membrane protein